MVIPIVDTHIHLYDTSRPGGVPWPRETDPILYRPVLPKDFDKVADANGVTATIVIEASTVLEDNQWVLDLIKHAPGRYIGMVGHLDIGETGFEKNLRQLAKDPRFVGLRLKTRLRGDAFFNDAVWRDFQIMADMGQTLDVLMGKFTLEEVNEIATRTPKLKIMINHVTGHPIDGKPRTAKWLSDVRKVAKHPHVYCKLSGMFQRSVQRPPSLEIDYYRPTLDALWQAFGAERLVYGSNWPVTDRGGTYADYKKVVMDYLEPKGGKAVERVLYKNALEFYGLELNSRARELQTN
ncbi:MAG: amidohydrolase family protein [Pirellulales bacterium]